MLTKLKRLLYDEQYFTTTAAVLLRGGVAFLGYCFDQGLLETGIPNGGARLGKFLYVVALFIAAGNRTPTTPAA